MEEVQDDKPDAPSGDVPEALRGLFAVLEEAGETRMVENYREALRRVKQNRDGSVIVELRDPVKVKGTEEDRLRLRSIRGRDYVDSTIADLVADGSYAGTVRFGSKLAEPKGVVEELAEVADIDAVYLAVIIVRGNFFRPKT